METLSPEERKDLWHKGIASLEDARSAKVWVLGEEIHDKLFGNAGPSIQAEPLEEMWNFITHTPIGHDIHVGGSICMNQGAYTEPDSSGHLVYRASNDSYFRDSEHIDAHGGQVYNQPFRLRPFEPITKIDLIDALGTRISHMEVEQGALFDMTCDVDVLGNQIQREWKGNHILQTHITSPDGTWATLLLQGLCVVGVRVPCPDRTVHVKGETASFEVEVPSGQSVSLGSLLAGQVSSSARVQWDGKDKVLTIKQMWRENVVGNSVSYSTLT